MTEPKLPRSLLPAIFLRRPKKLLDAGNKFRAQGDWAMTAVAYQYVVEFDPRRADIWMQLGHARKESGDMEGAGKAYFKAVELDPETSENQVQLGHYHKLCGDLELASDAYLKALELDPSSDFAYEELQQVGWSESDIIKAVPAIKGSRVRRRIDVSKLSDKEVFLHSLLQSLGTGRRVDAQSGGV